RVPLLGVAEAGLLQPFHQGLGAVTGAEQAIIPAPGRDAFATFADKNNGAAVLDDERGGAHAFYALVKILIEGITAVGGEHEVKRLGEGLHGGPPDKVA